MATATITADPTADTPAAPKGGGKKKLLLIVLAALLLLGLAGGGAAFFLLKKKAAAAGDDEADESVAAAVEPAKIEVDSGAPPAFVPLEPFTVNLADKEAERYAQVGVTLEVDGSKTSDLIKVYMPAIRNNILLLLSAKTAPELLSRDGKLKLMREIQRESLRPLGIKLRSDDADDADDGAARRKKPRGQPVYPIRAVHFSNIIVQ